MSITPAQKTIIDSIIDNQDTNYNFCGAAFLNGATGVEAREVEKEALERIGDRTALGSDDKVLQQIAIWNLQNSSDLNKKLLFYTLTHRSRYTDNLNGSDEICCTSTPTYIEIAKATLGESPAPIEHIPLNTQHNEMFPISEGIYYIGENNKLFGKETPYAFIYSTSTAACVYGHDFAQPISYQGYSFETMRGRTNYATGGSSSRGQYFFLTPGGGPLTSSNWIIKYVEYGIRFITEDDTYTSPDSPWVITTSTGQKYAIVKIFIHLFFPSGAYVRTILDRSDSADFTGVDPSMAYSWIYHDYANYQATQEGKTFGTIWDNYIYNKVYRPIGGLDPTIIDISFNWNGKLSATQQKTQIAYLKTDKSVEWKGGARS